MMSGALWVRDELVACGWQVEVADARKVKTVAPLAAKTDKVDARLLAELSRRQLVPALWLPSLDDRELRERLRRRMHLVRLRTSAKGRIFGLQTQWGIRHLAPAPAPRRRDDIARASGHARGLATLDQRVSGTDRLPRHTDRAAGRRAATVRPGRPARGAAGHDPRRRRAARVDDRGRDRRDQPLRRPGEARLLRPARATCPPIWLRSAAHGSAEQVGLAAARLGRGRGRPTRLARIEPLAPALPRRRPPLAQPQLRESRGRAQDPDRRLAHALPQRTLQTRATNRRHFCPGKLPLGFGRLTAPYGIEKPRQLPPTRCAPNNAKKEMSPTVRERERR